MIDLRRLGIFHERNMGKLWVKKKSLWQDLDTGAM